MCLFTGGGLPVDHVWQKRCGSPALCVICEDYIYYNSLVSDYWSNGHDWPNDSKLNERMQTTYNNVIGWALDSFALDKGCWSHLTGVSDHVRVCKHANWYGATQLSTGHKQMLQTRPHLPCCLQVFEPLVEKCKKLNRAMRIGTNHGSLSARILSYYGDTPRGMVESAFEFANICRNLDYHNFLFSMKASNPLVMVQAYRLLAEEMYSNGWDYPLHLGVTEVGHHSFSQTTVSVEVSTVQLSIEINSTIIQTLTWSHRGA